MKRVCSVIVDELIFVKFSEENDLTEVINSYKNFGFQNWGGGGGGLGGKVR